MYFNSILLLPSWPWEHHYQDWLLCRPFQTDLHLNDNLRWWVNHKYLIISFKLSTFQRNSHTLHNEITVAKQPTYFDSSLPFELDSAHSNGTVNVGACIGHLTNHLALHQCFVPFLVEVVYCGHHPTLLSWISPQCIYAFYKRALLLQCDDNCIQLKFVVMTHQLKYLWISLLYQPICKNIKDNDSA